MFIYVSSICQLNSIVSGIILSEGIIEKASLKVRTRLEGTITKYPFNLSVLSLKKDKKIFND
jgi:hypothetical protein